MQRIVFLNHSEDIEKELLNCPSNILIVCDQFCVDIQLFRVIREISNKIFVFSGFSSNPKYEEVISGLKIFKDNNCQAIIALGGGSAIDVAKCIKLFAALDVNEDFLTYPFVDSKIPLIAIPTTAGTGSESTRYAVIYKDGVKQSVTNNSIVPNIAILYPELLNTLPLYQKKCTLLDALCQAIESWWSVNSTEESKEFSKIALETIMKSYRGYIFDGDKVCTRNIMLASNYSGRAINITETTAPHAMSYKLTSLYNLPHGFAVAISLPRVWRFMLNNISKCVDDRGYEYLKGIFNSISASMGADSPTKAITIFESILDELKLASFVSGKNDDRRILTESVNPLRLKNNPVAMDKETLSHIYSDIVKTTNE